MKVQFQTPITPNFIKGIVGGNDVMVAVNEMSEEDLRQVIREWEAEMWLKFHKPKINIR